jgi:hypothetical protein
MTDAMEGLRRARDLVVLGVFVLALGFFASWPIGVAVPEEAVDTVCEPLTVAGVGVGDLVLPLRPADIGEDEREVDCSTEYSEGEVERIEPRLSS